ncbi:QcrA and Rieske domain-containing protein [Gordonia liuliyuniae]|uniref:Cytochrome bc1 complex Rieske iron-sulfur subunit n=1 Tax=Gordonia liuliyuniae TaxID=2911517 RepID=A0ABS9IUD2_9ACTN|nr:Rieske (2Fe-2S) protein [Gordonia liuliyuniae]MCF8589174.1 Rieske (2Fe-2S) protein [Gordonia liuliyuniae]
MTQNRTDLSRRTVLIAAPITAVALGAAACGSDDSSGSDGGSTGQTSTGQMLTETSKVPVGGGIVVGDVVVTQAKEGEFAAFSTKCPHQGCAVAPKGDKLDCPCHGSEFNLDGSLVRGPATEPLTPVAVQVRGVDVVRG